MVAASSAFRGEQGSTSSSSCLSPSPPSSLPLHRDTEVDGSSGKYLLKKADSGDTAETVLLLPTSSSSASLTTATEIPRTRREEIHHCEDSLHKNEILKRCWTIIGDVPLDLVIVVIVWYFIGVASICTTKILADKGVPPLVLTFQQLFLGSTLLRLHLGITGELQPLPKAVVTQLSRILNLVRNRSKILSSITNRKALTSKQSIDEEEGNTEFMRGNSEGRNTTKRAVNTGSNTTPAPSDEALYLHFRLMGVFDGFDFLSTAIGFTFANASFVETVKSSQPITTTAVALFFGIDTLQKPEAIAMAIIVAGVFCSTLGNAQDSSEMQEEEDSSSSNHIAPDASMTMTQAIETAMIGIIANLCFALRVNSQKKFRAHREGREMNDTNMLMWMQRMGCSALAIPIMLFELPGVIQRTRQSSFWEDLIPFGTLVLVNAVCFSLYTLTNTFVLSKVSVGQHTGLNALRRMFVIVFTAIFFGVPITPMKALGIVLCFAGFSGFSYYRNRSVSSIKTGENNEMIGENNKDQFQQPLPEPSTSKQQV